MLYTGIAVLDTVVTTVGEEEEATPSGGGGGGNSDGVGGGGGDAAEGLTRGGGEGKIINKGRDGKKPKSKRRYSIAVEEEAAAGSSSPREGGGAAGPGENSYSVRKRIMATCGDSVQAGEGCGLLFEVDMRITRDSESGGRTRINDVTIANDSYDFNKQASTYQRKCIAVCVYIDLNVYMRKLNINKCVYK